MLVVPSASSGGTKLCPPEGQKGPKDRPKEIPREDLMTQTSPTERRTTDPGGPKRPNSLQNRAPVPRLGSEPGLGPGPERIGDETVRTRNGDARRWRTNQEI